MSHYLDLMEWLGICKHLRYDLEGASKCYQVCLETEPENCEILVKSAGVKMDSGDLEASEAFFAKALLVNGNDADALLHRSNLNMLKRNLDAAQSDLEKCLSARPDFLIAHLRLATIYMHNSKNSDAEGCLETAASLAPRSSEVHSYKGELFFVTGDIENAISSFEKAIECEPTNPTPYVNLALALMNNQAAGKDPYETSAKAIKLLETSLEVDPQFQAAYIHLGQLKLSLCKTIEEASDVIGLYKTAICECRSSDETTDVLKMLVLAKAQVTAANLLGMKSLQF